MRDTILRWRVLHRIKARPTVSCDEGVLAVRETEKVKRRKSVFQQTPSRAVQWTVTVTECKAGLFLRPLVTLRISSLFVRSSAP